MAALWEHMFTKHINSHTQLIFSSLIIPYPSNILNFPILSIPAIVITIFTYRTNPLISTFFQFSSHYLSLKSSHFPLFLLPYIPNPLLRLHFLDVTLIFTPHTHCSAPLYPYSHLHSSLFYTSFHDTHFIVTF